MERLVVGGCALRPQLTWKQMQERSTLLFIAAAQQANFSAAFLRYGSDATVRDGDSRLDEVAHIRSLEAVIIIA